MPALPPVPFTAKIELIGSYGNAEWANVLHVNWASGNPAVGEAVTYVEAFATAWGAHIAPVLNTAVTLTTAKFTDISSDTGAQVESFPLIPGSGPSSGGDPASAAVVLSWAISRRYRGGKPRTYLCGISDTQHGVKDLTDAAIAAFQAAGAGFLSAVNAISAPWAGGGAHAELGVVHYRRAHVVLEPPIFDPYFGVTVHKRLDTQRRRLGKETT